MRRAGAMLALLALTGCPDPTPPREIRPDVRWGEDPCAECLMIVNEARFAAAYVTSKREVRRFDDIGGMLAYDREHREAIAASWVHDYQGDGWLRVEAAQFVRGKGLKTPMGSGVVAVATRERAEALSKKHGAEVTTWDALVRAKVGIERRREALPREGVALTLRAEDLGERITLEGRADNAKLGALLQGDGFSVWIAGLNAWPDGYWSMASGGKRVRVTGVLTEDHGLPAFERSADDPIRSGLEVPAGADLKAAGRRFLLRDATWEPLD